MAPKHAESEPRDEEIEKNPIRWIQSQLTRASDQGYATFMRRTLPREVESPVLGVRVGEIRAIVKALSTAASERALTNAILRRCARPKRRRFPDALEERLAVAFMIGRLKASFDRRVELVDAFLPWIDSWAVCDEFCAELKWRANERDDLLNYVALCLERSEPYALRFALVELLKWFVDREHIDYVLATVETLAQRKIAVRPVQTACSWLLCEAFIKFPETTLRYLRQNSLDDFTFNLALQKIGESLRVDPETKAEIRAMRRVRPSSRQRS